MKITCKQNLFAAALVCLLTATGISVQAAPLTPDQAKEELAYTIGTQAYIYGYPWIYLPTLRWIWVTKPINPERSPYAAVNHVWNSRQVMDANYRDGGSPNNDTLYSFAWLD